MLISLPLEGLNLNNILKYETKNQSFLIYIASTILSNSIQECKINGVYLADFSCNPYTKKVNQSLNKPYVIEHG